MRLIEQIEELENAPASVRERVDGLFLLDQRMRDLGSDFTPETLVKAKADSLLIYEAIERIDPATGKMIILNIDN